MEIVIAFLIFLLCMGLCLALGVTMLLPLGVGFGLFFALAVRQGHGPKAVLKMAAATLPESFIVIKVLLLIGCLTGLWRSCGTIAYFVVGGVSLMPSSMFLLAAFLLAAVMSFALGTSFGVTATCGVILMAIARAGGVDPLPAAGAIYSGVYVGDRGSPAASSGNLVAALTGTDMRDNVRRMLPSSVLPFLLCCGIYGALSVLFPMERTDVSVLTRLEEAFVLHWSCLIPAALMLVLPFCRVPIQWSMAASIAASFAVAMAVQGQGFFETLWTMLAGYKPAEENLSALLAGGGAVSMLEVSGILLLSGTYGGIFRETGMLTPVTDKLRALVGKIGRYPAMLLSGLALCAMFCNQTIGAIMQSQLAGPLYGPEEKTEKMLDMENSVILTAALVPWCIACSVPLGMMGVGAGAMLFGFYPMLLPLCFWVKRAGERKRERKTAE